MKLYLPFLSLFASASTVTASSTTQIAQIVQDTANKVTLDPNSSSDPFYFDMTNFFSKGLSVPAQLNVDYYYGGCKSEGGTKYVAAATPPVFEYTHTNIYGGSAELQNGYTHTKFVPSSSEMGVFDVGGNTEVCLDIQCTGAFPCGVEYPSSMLIQIDEVDGSFSVGGVTATVNVVAETSLTFGNGAVAVAQATLCSGAGTINLGESLCMEISHTGLPFYSIDYFDSFVFSQDGVDFEVIGAGGVSAATTTGPICTNDGNVQTCVIESPLPFVSGAVIGAGEVVFIANDTGDGVPNRRILSVSSRALENGAVETGEAKMDFTFEIVDPSQGPPEQESSTAEASFFAALYALAAGMAMAFV